MYPNINIFNIEISTYLLIHLIAFIINIFFLKYLSIKREFIFFNYYVIYILLIISSYISARFFGEFLYHSNTNIIEIIKNPSGETSVLGVIILFPIIILLFSIILKEKYFKILSNFIPILLVFQILGKVGCLLAGCCYGSETNCQISVKVNSPLDHFDVLTNVHPVQIYESLLYSIALIIFFKIYKKWKDIKIVFSYFFYYGIIRFIMEFFRGDSIHSNILFLTKSQIVAIIINLLSVFLYIIFKNKSSRN